MMDTSDLDVTIADLALRANYIRSLESLSNGVPICDR